MAEESFIKKQREDMGLSQSQFAALSGVNLRSLQEYEQGRKPLSSVKSEVLYRISRTLDCDMEDLIMEPFYTNNDMERRVYKYYTSLRKLLWPEKSKPISTPFDDVFKTLSVDCSELLIPVINEAFHENYSMDDLISRSQNEHLKVGDTGHVKKIISDTNFVVTSKDGRQNRYQIECQSTVDNTILMRIFEYSTSIACEEAQLTADRLKVSYPKSALIYLRHNSNTPDFMTIEVDTPGGTIDWRVPVIKTKAYSIDELFKKKLYMFIPYYILSYETEFEDIEFSVEKIEHLKLEYYEICSRLEKAVQDGDATEYEKSAIVNLTSHVLDYVLNRYTKTKKEVIFTLRGQVLDYEAKDIKNEGRIEGRREGRIEGRREGRTDILKKLLEMGVIDAEQAYQLENEDKLIQED